MPLCPQELFHEEVVRWGHDPTQISVLSSMAVLWGTILVGAAQPFFQVSRSPSPSPSQSQSPS